MLALKGIPYKGVHVLPGNQKIHLRLAGFRDGTVPALKIDGRRIQGSVSIAHELEALVPDPPLYPKDADRLRRVEEAERWGDQILQPVPRRIFRYALTRDAGLREWLARQDGTMPAPGIAARITTPVSYYYARSVKADEAAARQDIRDLPKHLDHVDQLIADGVVTTDRPNAATFQVLCSVRSLLGFADFEEPVGERSYAQLARDLFPDFPPEPVPPFVDRLGIA